MPRTQRWQQISHGFANGVLSPAAQDQVDGAAWTAGAADIVNFEVQRDGGLAGRPAFLRSEYVFTNPTHSAINPDTTVPGTTLDPREHDGFDGELGLRQAGEKNPAAFGTADSLYEVLMRGTGTGVPPIRAIVWHGCRLRRGEWETAASGGTGRRLNFTCEFQRGLSPGIGPWERADAAIMASGAAHDDPFGWGAFAPGQVARDIVVPLVPQGAVEAIKVRRVRLRLTNTQQAAPVNLSVRGVSAYTEQDTGLERITWYRRPPYRVVSWVAGNVPLVMVLTLERIYAYHVAGSRIQTLPGFDLNVAWYFTRRQLEELTWAAYGKGVLLFHKDFPYPVRVQLSEATQLAAGYLPLQNVPVVELDELPDVNVDVSEQIRVALPEAIP